MLAYLRRKKILKTTAIFLAANILINSLFSTAAYALTSGPGSPEFASFEPVATTDMVNLFSGDFNYNLPVLEIPGPDGGGYALSLSYHSGSSSEEESSWVGYGFSLNPGAINRNTRGFPDDYKDITVEQYNKSRPSWSASVSRSVGIDIFSAKLSNKDSENSSPDTTGISFNPSFTFRNTLRYNNYQGFAKYVGFGIGVKGLGSISMNKGAEGTTFSGEINVSKELFNKNNKVSKQENKTGFDWKRSLKKGIPKAKDFAQKNFGSTYGLYSFSEAVKATSLSHYKSISYNSNLGISVNLTLPIGVHAGESGNFTLHQSFANEPMRVQGFMHNPSTIRSNESSDYYVEKGNPFSKRDINLGIPFNNADNFMVTGEGLAGGFRFYPKQTGHFYPNEIENKTKILQTGFDLGIGASVAIGYHFGVGFDKSIIKDWADIGNTSRYRYTPNQGKFRFNQDMGGSVSYDNTGLTVASLYSESRVPGGKTINPYLPISLPKTVDTTKNTASSYIDYHTYNEITTQPAFKYNKGYNRSHTDPANPSSIAEISVHNSDGNQYIYGLPVYNRNETNLQVDVTSSQVPSDRYLAYKNLSLRKQSEKYVLDVLSKDHTTAIGEIRPTPYASNYLLTQIFTPDFVDVNNNGADSVDFGGWTQFHYNQSSWKDLSSTDSTAWYRWRMPYTGLLYNKNQLSDTKDDTGAIMSGEKEVYYLKAIETKTHIAFFVTNATVDSRWDEILTKLNLKGRINTSFLKGSGKAREDGLGAAALGRTSDPAATSKSAKSTQQLEYLEKIVLFSKSRPEQPIKTTKFQYDYSLVQNLPNHQKGNYPNNRDNAANNSGKLTLKKVWFEYESVVNSKISPYEFTYQYKDKSTFPDYIQKTYPEETSISNKYSDYAQNPDYLPHFQDPWGNLQAYGKERKKYMLPWLYQGPLPAGNELSQTGWRTEIPALNVGTTYKEFDPAAWQLKQIRLPSGGEILIEYEQKDYAYVQDRAPMAMASLLKSEELIDKILGDKYDSSPTYTINTRDLGLDPASPAYLTDLTEQIEKIKQYFANEKIYFKYLYAMTNRFGGADIDNCMSEYISGYAVVDKVEIENVVIGSESEQHIKITLKGDNSKNGNRTAVPRQACYEFYATQRIGKWIGNECESEGDLFEARKITPNIDKLLSGSLLDIPTRIDVVSGALLGVRRGLSNFEYNIPRKQDVGTNLNLALSYLKLPMIKAKKGGGIRVKRLLMYDPGIESGDAALYGQEYRYEELKEVGGKIKVISSGVATNEPSDAREENPLISFMPRKGQSWYSRITAGEDKEQTEGPLGETLLPAASIGHSKVIVSNIHQGATATGHTVHEYYTVKDYPFDNQYQGGANSDFGLLAKGVDYTNLSDNQKRDFMSIPAGFFYYEVNKVWASQGYRFIINSMHGQMRRMSSYPGLYNAKVDSSVSNKILSTVKPISSQEYEYYAPGEKVKMFYPDGSYRMEVPGKEMDLTMEMKAVMQQTMDLALDLDITIGLIPLPPPVVVSASPSFAYYNKGISTHVTSKIIRYPAIIKKVTASQDGVVSTTENIAFNAHTGGVVLTKTTDSFDGLEVNGKKLDGSMYALDLPASWYYPQMGSKSQDSINTNQLSAMAGSVISYSKLGNPILSLNSKWQIPTKNVISAQAQTFKKDWFLSTTDKTDSIISSQYAGLSGARVDLNKVWRPQSSYAYREDVLSANADTSRIYASGMMNVFYPFKDWHKGTLPAPDQSRWISASTVTKYSPNGNPLEEQNVLGIYSAAIFGYNHLLPVMVANNSRYSSIHFNDYEHGNSSGTVANIAHSGRKSLKLNNPSTVVLSGILADIVSFNKGAFLKLWLKSETDDPQLRLQIGSSMIIPEKVAQSGEWILYNAFIAPGSMPQTGGFAVTLLSNASNVNPVYIDDLRFQPKEAQSTCYVYDAKTLRLITQFDDQHFGLFYQYNDEGKLVRKLIETEKGLKTIQETQYNIPKKLGIQ